MAYTPTNWVDNTTPVNATNLNKIESALDTQDDRIVVLEGKPALPTVVNGQWVKGVGGLPVWAAITEADVTGLVADLAAKADGAATTAALATKEATANKGASGGYAPLDGSAKVPAANLPAAVSDALKEDKANKGVASGYAPLDASVKVPLANLPAMGASLAYLGDWAAGTYNDGDTVVKDGIVYQCVGGPTAVAPDPTLWGAAALVPGPTLLRKTTPKVVVNTTAATDLLNGEITLPALTPAQFVRLTAQGDWINNSGGTNTSFPRMQLLLGGTTLIDTGGIGSVAGYGGSPRYFWRVEAEIAMLGAGVQYVRFFYVCHMNQLTGIAARFTTGSGTVNCLTNTSTLGFLQADGYNNGAVDMATPRLLALNTILGFAHASIDITLKHAVVEIF